MRQLLIFILFLTLSSVLQAGEGSWVKRRTLPEVAIGTSYTLLEPTRIGQDVRLYEHRYGQVYLDYTRKDHGDLTASSSWRVKVDIGYYLNGVYTTAFLEINYEKNAPISVPRVYTDYVTIPVLDGELGFSFVVNSIVSEYFDVTTSSWLPLNLSSEIEIRQELHNELVYNLNISTLPTDRSGLAYYPTTSRIGFDFIEGSEEYDVEWVYIDKESKEYAQYFNGNVNNLSFYQQGGIELAFTLKEATRVRTKQTWFDLDFVFPEGVIFFRVRNLSTFKTQGDLSDQIKLGDWSYYSDVVSFDAGLATLNQFSKYEVTPGLVFETGKNWSYNVAFAEGGKSVSSVTYYDGTNRGRQNLTYNASDHVTLIGETKYDREGRSTIGVVPAPVFGKQLGYRHGFNLIGPNTIFDEADYDHNNYVNNATAAPPLYTSPGVASGAAQYFSADNMMTQDMFRAGVPDAEGYVYSQTIYRNDGTGRVERSGGIGKDFTVGGAHATRMYYGSPTVFELKRLFGENVPDALNGYRKEMVRDANGQLSVTYYDMRGLVIATGLAGESPTNLIALDDQDPVLATTPILDNNTLYGNNLLISEYTHLNQIENSSIILNYDVAAQIHQIGAQTISVQGHQFTVGQLCSSCRYNLEVIVMDQYGNHLPGSPYTQAIGPTWKMISVLIHHNNF